MKRYIRWGFVAAALWGGAALAQGDYGTGTTREREVRVTREKKYDDKGPYALIGGGVEGFTGKLAPNVNPGVTYGAELGFKPFSGLGLELGYNGGLHDLDVGPGGTRSGADVVRNAGQAAVIVDVPLGRIQPYALGGIGVNNYNVRTPAFASNGFRDDTSGYVPTGVGLRFNLSRTITADARATYNIPFSENFAPFDTGAGSGRYQGMLQLGGQY